MRRLERRLARLEAMKEYLDDLVDPEQLQRMAAVVLDSSLDQKLRAEAERIFVNPQGDIEAECRRIREKLLSGGPHVPAGERPGVESDARRILREKLLRDDVPPAAEAVRA